MMILRSAWLALAFIGTATLTKELVRDHPIRLDDFLHDAMALRGLFHLRNEAKCGDPQEEQADDCPESTRLGMEGLGWFHSIRWLV